MKKDNFDLRSYLIENKMTENSRGDVRHQLGETILDTRILSEMQIPAEGDSYTGDEEYEDDPYGLGEAYEDHHDPEYTDDVPEGPYDSQRDLDFDAAIDECGPELGSDMPIDEAGYTDDEDDDWTDPDAIGDDDNGASLLDLVRGDKKAAKARKAATKDAEADLDPTAGEPEDFGDEPAVDPEDAEPSAGESDPNAEAQPGLSAQIKYNPNTVEMMMDNQELDQYLSGFRRPQVAVNVLNRAIRTAQDEVNDSIGLNHLYIVLENGFYVTSRTERGQVIAKVNADQEWRRKNFGED